MNIINKSIFLYKSPFLTSITRSYAKKDAAAVSMLGAGMKKKKGKVGPVAEKTILPVETDTNKLVSFVCGSNIMKTGPDVRLGPDSDYPDWLWRLRTDSPPKLEDLDPDTKEYWKKVRKMAMRRNNTLQSLKRF